MWEIEGKRTSDLAQVQKYFNLKYPPMVQSLLDQDLYKFTMSQLYHTKFSSMHATWDFKARNVGDDCEKEKYTQDDLKEIKKQLQAYCALRFEDYELKWLSDSKARPWIHHNFVNFLKFWHPVFSDITVESDEKTGLSVTVKGVQEYISYYEIPILEIAAEVYYRNHYFYDGLVKAFKEKTLEKLDKMNKGIYNPGVFSEFGTRRRLSYETQEWLIETLKNEKAKNDGPIQGFIGTSNCHLARKFGLTAVGTMAHEYIESVGQGLPYHNPAYSNWYALDAWIDFYGTKNGIALTDTIGTDVFLRDFQTTFATVFSGVRHDSGDPYEWGEKMINHYKSLGIDPLTKTLMFSDSLDLEKATNLYKYFRTKAKVAFGIGTDWSGPQSTKALNIVCKVVKVNGRDIAKLSDVPGKVTCRSQEAVDRLKSEIAWRMKHEN